jgi:hypothetical protein
MSVIKSDAYIQLSHPAKSLVVDVVMQLSKRAANNGQLICTEKLMRKRGWNSKGTLNRAKKELLDAGFLYETVKGHRPNKASWYALTCFSLGPSDRYDAGAKNGFIRSEYNKVPLLKNASISPPKRRQNSIIGPNKGLEDHRFAPSERPIRPSFDTSPTPSKRLLLDKPSEGGVFA